MVGPLAFLVEHKTDIITTSSDGSYHDICVTENAHCVLKPTITLSLFDL